MEKRAEGDDFEIPPPPQQPPLFIFHDTKDQPGVVRFAAQEGDIVRAQREVRRLLTTGGALQAWIIQGVQMVLRPDGK